MRIGYAVAAGIAAVIAAVAIFLASAERRVIGTNTIGPLYAAVSLFPERPVCERVKRVPAGAGYLRLRVELTESIVKGAGSSSTIRGIRVDLADSRGRLASGVAHDFEEGLIEVPLSREGRAARNARLCVHSLDRRLLSLFGEDKRPFPGAPPDKWEQRFAVTFLQSDPSSRLARVDTVAERYELTQGGLVGGWTLWLAGLLAVAASTLALWLVARGPRRR
ncbi:MAG: hypothetical protein ACRDL6_12340 [Solirubrobacterales bacterium]